MATSVLNRIASGDASAMQDCIDTYGGLVWSLARRFSPSAADAEEAAQDVFVAVWESASRYREDLGAEVTFVAMIARRRLIDGLRRRERRERAMEKARAIEEQSWDNLNRKESMAAVVDEARMASEAMDELTEPQRRVLTLAIHHGLTHDQIAVHTGLPLGTVKTHARRGMIRLRESLQPDPTSAEATNE